MTMVYYAPYAINMQTWRVQSLLPEEVSEWDPFYRENPPIMDSEEALYGG